MLDAAHLGVDLLEDAGALLQAEDDVLLDQGELDAARELLELGQLGVRLGQELLLVLLAAQGEERALLVARRQHPTRHVCFLVCQDADSFVVLPELVSLEFQVEDRSGFRGERGLAWDWNWETKRLEGKGREENWVVLVLRRYTAVVVPHLEFASSFRLFVYRGVAISAAGFPSVLSPGP